MGDSDESSLGAYAGIFVFLLYLLLRGYIGWGKWGE